MEKQAVGLETVSNARELGGYSICGRTVRRGLLLRSGSLYKAGGEDIRKLSQDYHLGAVIDFRMPMEQKLHPDTAVPGAVHYALPVMDDLEPADGTEQLAALLDPDADRLALLTEIRDISFFNDKLYLDFLRTERGIGAYRQFFRILLDLPEEQSILWHCTDGKDRTGVAAMLLLSALGADRTLILQDYLLTNTFNASKLEAARRSMAGYALSKERQEMYLFTTAGGVYARFLETAMEDLDAGYGSVESYLTVELGVGAAEKKFLQNRYLV